MSKKPMPKKRKKHLSEKETRENILRLAQSYGCAGDVLKIFEKYDKALKNCTNEVERKHMAHLGAIELHKLLDCYGALVVDGQTLLEAQPGHEGT